MTLRAIRSAGRVASCKKRAVPKRKKTPQEEGLESANTGNWDDTEKCLFVRGLLRHGKDWPAMQKVREDTLAPQCASAVGPRAAAAAATTSTSPCTRSPWPSPPRSSPSSSRSSARRSSNSSRAKAPRQGAAAAPSVNLASMIGHRAMCRPDRSSYGPEICASGRATAGCLRPKSEIGIHSKGAARERTPGWSFCIHRRPWLRPRGAAPPCAVHDDGPRSGRSLARAR